LAADVTLLIRSEVKVAIPHFLGVKEEINATFFGEPFTIPNTFFEMEPFAILNTFFWNSRELNIFILRAAI
jgi:hypothetical protein